MEISSPPEGVLIEERDGYLRIECSHARREVRSKMAASGRITFWRQCMICGNLGEMIKHKEALSEGGGHAIRPVDHEIWDRYRIARTALEESYRQQKSADWWSKYDRYLESGDWKRRRRLVLERANNLCEGCRVRPATQVHHLTYKNVCDEFLWELVAVCTQCHEKAHATT